MLCEHETLVYRESADLLEREASSPDVGIRDHEIGAQFFLLLDLRIIRSLLRFIRVIVLLLVNVLRIIQGVQVLVRLSDDL